MKEDKGTIKVTVRDSAGRNVPIKRVKRGSKGEAILETGGFKGPAKITSTLSQVGPRSSRVQAQHTRARGTH